MMSSIDAPDTVFKPIFVPAYLEEQTVKCLQIWFPTYIRYVSAKFGAAALDVPPPANYTTRNSFDALPGELIPKCVVISPGLADTPMADGGGSYRATWQLGVGVATAQQDEELASLHTDIYGASVRAIVLQQLAKYVGMDSPVMGVAWVGETYEDLPIPGQIQQYRAAAVYFFVEIADVVNRWAGPDQPDSEPYGYGQAHLVDVTLVNEGTEALPDIND